MNDCLNCKDEPKGQCYECHILQMTDAEYTAWQEKCDAGLKMFQDYMNSAN